MTGPTPLFSVSVRAGEVAAADYDVVVGRGLLARLPALLRARLGAHRYAVISDETVARLHGAGVRSALNEAGLTADLHTFPEGEARKNRETWAGLTDGLLAAGHGRDSAVVAVGGGVTGDVAGFVAATYMRGIPVVQVPTSLVAMVDAAVGGKTGLDVPAGKNLVGAFHPPRLVVVDPELIGTLPRSERAQGLAEAIKHGAILDGSYLKALEEEAAALLEGRAEPVEQAVLRSVELKADVVSRDEREGGLRQILNFGHTLGHALEAAAAYRLGHGSAVALGMVLEARVGETLGITETGTADRLSRILERFELPGRSDAIEVQIDVDAVLRVARDDKKTRRGSPRYVLLEGIGRVARAAEAWSHEVPDDVVRNVLSEDRRTG